MRLCGIFIPSLGRRMSSPSTRRVANFTLFTPSFLSRWYLPYWVDTVANQSFRVLSRRD